MSALGHGSSLVLGSFFLFAAGCAVPTTHGDTSSAIEASESGAIASPDELQARIATAKAISSMTMRDEAFVAVALDASKSSEIDLCLEALENVASMTAHDRTAGKAARTACHVGELDGARRIAMKISSMSDRDSALAAIAAGQ